MLRVAELRATREGGHRRVGEGLQGGEASAAEVPLHGERKFEARPGCADVVTDGVEQPVAVEVDQAAEDVAGRQSRGVRRFGEDRGVSGGNGREPEASWPCKVAVTMCASAGSPS